MSAIQSYMSVAASAVSRPAGAPGSSGSSSPTPSSISAPSQGVTKMLGGILGLGDAHTAAKNLSKLQAELDKALETLNEHASVAKRSLGFSFDESLNRSIVRVTDLESGKVIRQIPHEVVIRVAKSIESFKGSMVDERA
ncbi:FlaG Uncharacterized flagellar protein FlaG [Burkholderiales bacterium]